MFGDKIGYNEEEGVIQIKDSKLEKKVGRAVNGEVGFLFDEIDIQRGGRDPDKGLEGGEEGGQGVEGGIVFQSE